MWLVAKIKNEFHPFKKALDEKIKNVEIMHLNMNVQQKQKKKKYLNLF